MNRQFFITLLALLASATALADGRWLEQTFDFGAFDEDLGTVYCDFRLVNDGPEPLAIIGARANCGCTKPEYDPAPVAPGDTAVIHVGFDASGRPGRFNKRVYVDCDSSPLRSTLTICGTVIGRGNTLRSRYPVDVEGSGVKLRTATIPYGKIYRGETSGQYIEAYNASSDTIRPYVTEVPGYINVMIQPVEVPPGEQFIVSTVLHSGAKTPDWGIVTDQFLFHPDRGSEASQRIETVAIVGEDFSKLTPAERESAPLIDTSTTAIDLGRISRDDKPIRASFDIENKGKSPLIIRRIYTTEPEAVEITLKDTRIKPGKSAKVSLTVTPSRVKSAELLNTRINIIANDPDHPTTTVRVVAEIAK